MTGPRRWILAGRQFLAAIAGAIAVATIISIPWHLQAVPSRASSGGALATEAIAAPGAIHRDRANLLAQAEPVTIGLSNSNPANGQMDIPINSILQFEFDRPLDDEFEELDVTIDPPISLAFNTEDNRLVLEPAEPMTFSTDYLIQIPSQAAIPLTEDIQVEFRTEPQFTYEDDVLPLLDASCVGCHRPAGRARRWALDSYDAVLDYIDKGDPDSELLDPIWTNRHAVIARARRFTQSPIEGTSTQITSGSPEVTYTRQKGYSLERLGQWTPAEAELVTTWIVQDEAAENSAARALRQ
ncbi:Ig-like domain-containing protein [Synechococcus sp. PCC 7336]|uniref:Ig-like domain-containing protein n=1 Tax=Synechococcus sp. PCC 7336 TaxID=195250 RepID=UPI00035D13CD|nr:Ig-like domain-containing protein [Synechococcus sp. PCC 7336]